MKLRGNHVTNSLITRQLIDGLASHEGSADKDNLKKRGTEGHLCHAHKLGC